MKFKKTLKNFLFLTLLFSTGYSVYNFITAPSGGALHIKSDYLLMTLQCVLGLLLMTVPSIIEKRLSLNIPNKMTVIYFVFLYCAIYLGEVRNFYYIIPYWDSFLHCLSGAMLGFLGFLIVRLFNESEKVSVRLSPLFLAVFAFCFSLALGTLWEIYEFTGDFVFGLNMQKYRTAEGVLLLGRAALSDTMKDMIVDAIGALVISVFGYFFIKKRS
ncbi:MAG: hypothetical protein IJT38_04555 [Clostridia bacterium]|nr:hypothetical protein [Clostridia bacterium]